MSGTRILATGSYLPLNVVSNDSLAKKLDTSDEWISSRTGIKQRHLASKEETTLYMATEAAKVAISRAKIAANEIDLIVCASCSSEQIFPSLACNVQNALNIERCCSYDVAAACSGFIYALVAAHHSIITGVNKKALVIGSEVMSNVVDWEDRSTCVLFGDAAGAMIITADNINKVLSYSLQANAKLGEALYLNSARGNDKAFLQMQGGIIFKQAVSSLSDVAMEIMAKADMSVNDIDWFIPHQANIRIMEATAKKLGFSASKIISFVEKHANTSAASVPLALDMAIADGRVKRDQVLLLEAVGGGLTWGAILLRY